MLRRFLVAISTALALMLSPSVWATNASGSIRGVTFFHLDGQYNDLPWVLDHLSDPDVQAKLNNLFATYQAAGVNWIRLLIAPDFFETYAARFSVPCSTQPTLAPCSVYPNVNQALLAEVNQFLAMTAKAGFKVELNINPHSVAGMPGFFCDSSPMGPNSTTPNCSDPYYYNDKEYYNNWFAGLNMANVGMVMLGGGINPCNPAYGCDRQGATNPMVINNGEWIMNIWAWKKANFPTLNATYETVGVIAYNGNPNDTTQIGLIAKWMDQYTPGLPYNAMSLYVSQPSDVTPPWQFSPPWQWGNYATATDALLDAYAKASNTPLWIDEYGTYVGWDQTEADQYQALLGFLGASVCQRMNQYPKFLWEAGNDYPNRQFPYPTTYPLLGVMESFGLVMFYYGGSGGSLDTPYMRQGWSAISQFYNMQSCQ